MMVAFSSSLFVGAITTQLVNSKFKILSGSSLKDRKAGTGIGLLADGGQYLFYSLLLQDFEGQSMRG
jgi:hypothetical protein